MPVMLYLRGFSAKDLAHVLEFIYKGNVNLHQHELDNFLAVAKSLQIPLDDEEEDNQGALSKPSKRSSPTPSSVKGWKQKIKRPKKTMSPKLETNGNHSEMVKVEESNEPELLEVDDDEAQGEEAAHGYNAIDDLGERISAGAAAMKDTFIYENVEETGEGFHCKPCGKVLKYRAGLVRHVVDQHVNFGVRYQCPHCSSISGTKSTLQSHMCRKHPEIRVKPNYDQCAIYGEAY